MKNKILLILTSILINCSALLAQEQIPKLSDAEIDAAFSEIKQNFTESPQEWVFSKVIKVEGKSADDIFVKSKSVLSTINPEVKDAIQTSDKDAGVIVAKVYATSNVRTYSSFIIALYRVLQDIKIEVKEGRYKLTLTTSAVQCQCGGTVDKNAFGDATIPLSYYFPYDRNFKKNMRPIAWDLLKFTYDANVRTMTEIESRIAKELSSEEW